MFKFMKKILVSTLIFFGSLLSVNPFECVSMNNQEWRVRPEIVNVNSNEPLFYLLVLKQVNVMVVVTILMIPMQNCVFLMLLKI